MNKRILVNKTHLIKSHQITGNNFIIVKDIEGKDVLIDQLAWQSFQFLQNYLSHKKIEIGIDSAYRSFIRQEELLEEFTQKYGKEYAMNIVAPSGASEHHTGLAIDITIKDIAGLNCKEEEGYNIIHKYLANFGFILRYPSDKEKITKYPYEPWHIRYVGIKLAKYLKKNNLTLEEYYKGKRK